MPLISFKCRTHSPPPHFEVPLDHWSSGEAHHPPHEDFDPKILSLIVEGQRSDSIHVKTNLTPTTVLGCPRKTIIERYHEYSAFPDDFYTAFIGSMAHDGIASKEEKPGCVTEERVKGQLFGTEFVGKIDRVDFTCKDTVRIVDYKFTSGYRMKWVPQQNDEMQVNMYKHLYESMYPGVIVSEMRLNYMAVGGAKRNPKQKYVKVAPVSEDDILRYKPHGGKYSVRDHIGQLQQGFEGDHDAARMPLFGQLINWGGKPMCTWCPVQSKCLGEIEGKPSMIEEP